MTFSCPHYDIDKDKCWRLKTECVPGRPGCVMRNNSRFAVPAEQRVAEAREETRRKEEGRHREACGHPECPLGAVGEAKTPAGSQTKKAGGKKAGAKPGATKSKGPTPPSRAGRGRRG